MNESHVQIYGHNKPLDKYLIKTATIHTHARHSNYSFKDVTTQKDKSKTNMKNISLASA